MAPPLWPPSPQPLVFFLLLLLSLLSLISPSLANPNHNPNHLNSNSTSFIWKSCRSTRYPALCYHCLSGFANEIKRSERRLALTALAVSLTRARSTAEFVHKLKKSKGVKISHRELQAVKDCIDTMGDTVDQLSRSIKELGQMGHADGQDFLWHMSNVQTWVSAALTNENTCVEGFSESEISNLNVNHKGGRIKGAIKMRVSNVAQVTSNALALVNRFADRYGAAYKDAKNP